VLEIRHWRLAMNEFRFIPIRLVVDGKVRETRENAPDPEVPVQGKIQGKQGKSEGKT